jgi:hypothetical protein
MNDTTKHGRKKAKKLDAELCRIVLGTYGMSAQIATLMHGKRPGTPNRANVWRIVHRLKPPSRRFLLALAAVLDGAKRRVNGAILRRAHPEIESEKS